MHRDKDVTPGEDGYTNRPGHAPRNIPTLNSAVRTLPERACRSYRNSAGKSPEGFVSDKQKNGFL